MIRFIGLCIHLDRSAAPELPYQRRVVLLANPEITICGHTLAPHVPKLKLPRPMCIDVPGVIPMSETLYRLDGVTMEVEKPDAGLLVDASTWGYVPHLTRPDEPLELDEGVAYAMVPPAVAYFDFGAGRYSACHASGGGALGTTLMITTKERPTIELASFHTVAKCTLELEDGDRIVITNVADGDEDRDDEYDYLLNYAIATNLPDDPPKPRKLDIANFPKCIDPDVDQNLGPSCSNSNFP